MSDTVTVRGDGQMNYSLMLKLNSQVRTVDFRGNDDTKNIVTGYVPAANFSFKKVTSDVPAAPQLCAGGGRCGGGSYASVDVTASAGEIELTGEGSAPCGMALGPGFHRDYYYIDNYFVGYVGYTDNAYIAVAIANKGTKAKPVDIYLGTGSEIDSQSKNYVEASANAELCIDQNCTRSPTGAIGSEMKNGTVVRAIIRPGSHWIVIGRMNNRFANTNTIHCPSAVKATSRISVRISEADMNDGKKSAGTLYSYEGPSGIESVWRPK